MSRLAALLCSLLLVGSALSAAPALAAEAERFGGGAAPDKHQAPRLEFVAGQVGAPKNAPLTGEALDAETHRVSLLLRCPVCQGSTVADSPAESARNMKAEVRDLLAMGFEEEQILRYFELSYGEFVRLAPKLDGLNVLVWVGPALLLLGGAVAVFFALRKMKDGKSAAPVEVLAEKTLSRDELPDDPELAAYVLKVRELAYGWPGGRSPQGTSSPGSGGTGGR